MSRGFFLLPTLLAACATLPPASHPVAGEWGGRHVRLSLGLNDGTLEYDCAAGTITGPLQLRLDGTFDAEGTLTPGRGGPEIEGQETPSFRVRYSGNVRGNTMSFQGRVENGVLLGPFILRRGADPIIFRCL